MRALICRSTERRRASQCNDAQFQRLRRSSSPGINETDLNRLGIPVQERRRGSLNTLSVPAQGIRRRSYSGPCCDQASTISLPGRRKSSLQSSDRFGFNPFVEKLSSNYVIKVICGMVLLITVVLLFSFYRLLT